MLKQLRAFELLKEKPCISSQVIIESYNACRKKLELKQEVCEQHVLFLTDITHVIKISDQTIRTAISFRKKYHLSFLDSIIVASAFGANCRILFSEDMQHNQVIEKKLKIVNPFV